MRPQILAALLSVVFGLLYLAMPIDLIPDLIPFFGMIDDVLVGGASALTGLGLAGSALWLERRGKALAAPKAYYEPLETEEIRSL